jgi:toxin ParE1/3/4
MPKRQIASAGRLILMSGRRLTATFTPTAIRDLEDIARRSTNIWGKLQSEKYQMELKKAFERLSDHPLIGRVRPDFGDSIRSIAAANHLIVYRQKDDELTILRIMDSRRDVTSAFPSQSDDL